MSLGSSMLLQYQVQYQGFIFSWIDSTLPYPLIHCRTTQMTPSRTLNQAALNRAQTALPDGSSLWICPRAAGLLDHMGVVLKRLFILFPIIVVLVYISSCPCQLIFILTGVWCLTEPDCTSLWLMVVSMFFICLLAFTCFFFFIYIF